MMEFVKRNYNSSQDCGAYFQIIGFPMLEHKNVSHINQIVI
jgi:hypothetical protein